MGARVQKIVRGALGFYGDTLQVLADRPREGEIERRVKGIGGKNRREKRYEEGRRVKGAQDKSRCWVEKEGILIHLKQRKSQLQ